MMIEYYQIERAFDIIKQKCFWHVWLLRWKRSVMGINVNQIGANRPNG